MSLHKRLLKQAQKHLPDSLLQSEDMQAFLYAVSNSYTAYENKNEQAERTFRLCEEDLREINDKLKQEIGTRQQSISKLKEAIELISNNAIHVDTDDLPVITEYISTETKRRKSAEEKFALLLANLQCGIILEDENELITFVNTAFCEMFEIHSPAENLIGTRRIDGLQNNSHLFKHPQKHVNTSIKISADRKLVTSEVLEMANGKTYERDFIPIFIEGEYKGNLCTYTNVTEKKKTQEAIRIALETIGDNVWEHDYNKDETTFSKAYIDMIGYTAGSGVSLSDLYWSRIHPDDRHIVAGLDSQYRNGDINAHEKEYRMVDNNDNIHWVLDRGLMMERATDGSPLKTIGTHTDISKIKETEQALRESEQSFRSIAENVPGVIYKYHYKNKKGSFIYISPNPQDKIGLAAEQLENFYSFIHPDDFEREREIRRRTIGQNTPYHFEGRFIVPDKPVIWLCISSSLTRTGTDGTLVYTGIITNITKEKEAGLALQMREAKYRNILANMNLGLMEVDNADMIRNVNQSFCEMSGYNAGELVGHLAAPIFLKGENVFVMKEKNSMRKNGYSDVYEMMIENKDGDTRWWLISGAPSYNDAGMMVGSIGIHLDITEQKKLETDLIKARKEAEESAKSKQVFLANMSHEIRTPMNAILGMSKQLSKTVLNHQQRLFLETIHSAADNLLVVINDVLDLSKMEAGKLSIETIGFGLQEVVQRAINVVKHKAEEKGLELHLKEWDTCMAEVLMGDPYRLNQVLLNLLSNAVKFTEKGSIAVSCRCLENNDQHQLVQLSVEDTGIGMDEEYIDKIFDAFNQEYNSNTRKFGGTGLGMHICKQLVEMMGGSIEVRSKKGAGTKIILSIDYKKGYAQDIHSNDIMPFETEKLTGKKLLVVDDNDMNRFLLEVIFQGYQCTIIEARNGKEAIDILRKENVDLVLMDIQMPVMDGTQATRIIRKELRLDIPVIALTANAIKGYQEEYMQSGMNAYVLKPFNEDDLLRTVINWIGEKKELHNISAPVILDNAEPKSDKLFNLAQLVEISRNNDAFVAKMMGLFIMQAQAFLNEIEEAVQQHDLPKIASVSHRFKPSVGNICQPFLFDEIKHLEHLAQNEEPIGTIKEAAYHFQELIRNVVSQLEDELAAIAEQHPEKAVM